MNDQAPRRVSAKTAPIRQLRTVDELLINENAAGQLGAVAAAHMNPQRLMRVTANAIRQTPKLKQADPLSFLGALMNCAALGLEPNTPMGHAFLIPFENRRKGIIEVQVVIGYKGLIDLARRSGHITAIHAGIHYSDDELWEYEEGTEARLRHVPGPQDGEKLHAYAIARFREGGHAYVVLPWSRVLKIRDGSSGYRTAVRYNKTDNPWQTHIEAMAQKTAIRALAKYLPLSVEFMDAVASDHDSGNRVDYAGYALNPAVGALIEGETSEPDPDPDPVDDTGSGDEDGSGAESAGDGGEAARDRDAGDGGDADPPAEKPASGSGARSDAKPGAKSGAKPAAKSAAKSGGSKGSDAKAPEAESAPDDDPDLANARDAFNKIIGDLDDGAPVDSTLYFHAEGIDLIRRVSPDLAKDLDEEIGARRDHEG